MDYNLTDEEIVQRKLEGRCLDCGKPAPTHTMSCPQAKFHIFGDPYQYEITDLDHDYDEQ